jgi:uncharacterized membrane protein
VKGAGEEKMFYLPTIVLFMLAFFVLLVLLFTLIMVGTISYAFDKVGLDPGAVFGLLLACLAGSYINIPLHRIRNEQVVTDQVVPFFGFRWRVPMVTPHETVVTVNVGGAVIPCLVAIYLLAKTAYPLQAVIGIAIVAAISKRLARPVPGLGIAMPAFIPPILSALTALLLAPAQAPMVAYISGTFGVLIGADLLHLRDLAALRTPVVSIGGAGTFDGIFLTGIIAVLLA